MNMNFSLKNKSHVKRISELLICAFLILIVSPVFFYSVYKIAAILIQHISNDGDIDSIKVWLEILTFSVILFGFLIAYSSYISQREMARKRATLDLMNKNIWDKDSVEAQNMFISLALHSKEPDDGQGLEFWANSRHSNSQQYQMIRSVMNDYELIALGIRKGIIDENFYKFFYKSAVLSHWDYAEAYVNKLRGLKKNGNIFIEYENLVRHWKNDEIYEGVPDDAIKSKCR